MKIYFLLLFLIISCTNNSKLYDISPPVVEDISYFDDNILIQLDEPVFYFKIINNDKPYHVNLPFPTANIYINPVTFINYEPVFSLEVKDKQNNKGIYKLKTPIINPNKVNLVIKNINLKYSKNKNQYIIIKTLNNGYTKGYKLVYFSKKQLHIFNFDNIKLKENQSYYIYLKYNKTEKSNQITFINNTSIINTKNRLSKHSTLLYIVNHKNEIEDYLYYYDSKYKSKDKIEESNYYNFRRDFLENKYYITPVMKDIRNL